MEFARIDGETTATWLRRLINIGAPADYRANVMALLENERTGSDLIPLIPICSLSRLTLQLMLPPIHSFFSFNEFILFYHGWWQFSPAPPAGELSSVTFIPRCVFVVRGFLWCYLMFKFNCFYFEFNLFIFMDAGWWTAFEPLQVRFYFAISPVVFRCVTCCVWW